MIIICEPNCRQHSHETFNLGFIHGARKAWTDEDILVVADESHCRVLLDNAKHFPADIRNISFKFVRLYVHDDFINVIWNYFLIWKVIRLARHKRARAVMFLSSTLIQQRIIKYLGRKLSNVVFTINMHGELDKLAYPDFKIEEVKFQNDVKNKDSHFQRFWVKRKQLLKILFSKIKKVIQYSWDKFGSITFPNLDLNDTLLRDNFENIRYVCLANHIRDSLPKYIDTSRINLKTIILPAVFHHNVHQPNNSFLKIAIFGYGHSTMLYKLNCALNKYQINRDYEIRIIGMDGRGIENFPHTKQPIKRVLTRHEMEVLAEDIDMFLILYEKERYVLSCSGSIIEAHQYGKPVIYLQNPCIDAFNPNEAPIGISCKDVENMASVLTEIINKYDDFKPRLLQYRKNIMAQREKIDITSNLDSMRGLVD